MKEKNSFDKETWLSILNSFLLNCIGAAGAFMVALPQVENWKGAAIIALSTFGAFLVNVPREWLRGDESKTDIAQKGQNKGTNNQ